MSEEIVIKVPKKLAEFIDNLKKEGYYSSRKDFARSSIEIVAQLYGLPKTKKGGKSLLDVLGDNKMQVDEPVKTKPPQQPFPPKIVTQKAETLSPEEYDVLDLFAGAKFEFEDALYARFTMELMKLAKAPIQKEAFLKLLGGLAAKKKIEKTEHSGKSVWKLIDDY
ncbi:MAG: hypothetical protein KAQ95_01940 [Candidatus Heimdallarchaeota archaeon]|nr:hypothetical protein [Candidatus Heimdallarchaeota archaeon]